MITIPITHRYQEDKNFDWESIPYCHSDKNRDLAIQILKTYDVFPVDCDDSLWRNGRDTLVLGIPDISSLELLRNATEWINDWTVDLMKVVFLLKPSEFSVEAAEQSEVGVGEEKEKNPIAFVVRMWWD